MLAPSSAGSLCPEVGLICVRMQKWPSAILSCRTTVSKIGWPVRKAKAIFLTGQQVDLGDSRKRSYFGVCKNEYFSNVVEFFGAGTC